MTGNISADEAPSRGANNKVEDLAWFGFMIEAHNILQRSEDTLEDQKRCIALDASSIKSKQAPGWY